MLGRLPRFRDRNLVMKIHAYKVVRDKDSVPLAQVLESISNQRRLDTRIRRVYGADVRAEAVRQKAGIWLLDLVRIRTNHGPGKVGRDSPVTGFDFAPGEGFGEETAALFDPSTDYMLVQYNHVGVRAGAIAEYLSVYDPYSSNAYQLRPKFASDVETRLRRQTITKDITFQIDLPKMTSTDREYGHDLASAIEFGREKGAERVTVSISVHGRSRDKGLRAGAKQTISSLRRLMGSDPDAVRRLEISGKEDADAITETLNLVAHRLTEEFGDLRLGADLRYPRAERWRALERAKNGWKSVLV